VRLAVGLPASSRAPLLFEELSYAGGESFITMRHGYAVYASSSVLLMISPNYRCGQILKRNTYEKETI
jgi:hypothetical protein